MSVIIIIVTGDISSTLEKGSGQLSDNVAAEICVPLLTSLSAQEWDAEQMEIVLSISNPKHVDPQTCPDWKVLAETTSAPKRNKLLIDGDVYLLFNRKYILSLSGHRFISRETETDTKRDRERGCIFFRWTQSRVNHQTFAMCTQHRPTHGSFQ